MKNIKVFTENHDLMIFFIILDTSVQQDTDVPFIPKRSKNKSSNQPTEEYVKQRPTSLPHDKLSNNLKIIKRNKKSHALQNTDSSSDSHVTEDKKNNDIMNDDTTSNRKKRKLGSSLNKKGTKPSELHLAKTSKNIEAYYSSEAQRIFDISTNAQEPKSLRAIQVNQTKKDNNLDQSPQSTLDTSHTPLPTDIIKEIEVTKKNINQTPNEGTIELTDDSKKVCDSEFNQEYSPISSNTFSDDELNQSKQNTTEESSLNQLVQQMYPEIDTEADTDNEAIT